MASHVPFLAVRPDDQFDTDTTKARDFASTNGAPKSLIPVMEDLAELADAPEAPKLGRVPPVSRLPAWIRFPLVVLLSLALGVFLYGLFADFGGEELAAISRKVEDEWYVGTVVVWKLATLSGAWYAGYDWKDLASLTCLSNLPYYFLLNTFYSLDRSVCAAALLIDIATIAIPFLLLKPLIHAHGTAPGGKTPNQQVAQDATIFGLMGLFGAAIYAAVIYGSLCTWLPAYLVFHFNKVRSVQSAHDAGIPLLVGLFIPVGWATTQFLFTPMIGARGNPGITDPALKPEMTKFDAENATFGETVAFNLGFGPDGLTKRGEVLAKRTAALVVCSVINTFVRVFLTIEGTEPVGAIAWASVWGIAAALTSVAYAWTGNE